MFTAKDQHLFQNGLLLEAGVATSSFYTQRSAPGRPDLRRQPNGTSGNYYLTNHGQGGRTEVIGNVFLPPLHEAGKHEFKMGIDIDRFDDHQELQRGDLT